MSIRVGLRHMARSAVAVPITVPWLNDWDKRVKITIDSGDIDAALSNFPVLIHLSASCGKDSQDLTFVFDEVGANSLKIAVTESDAETELFVEVEKWDLGNEQAWLWVKVPTVTHDADTEIYLYFDNGHADNTAYVGPINSIPARNVWDANFKGVWHLTEDPSGLSRLANSQGDPEGLTNSGGFLYQAEEKAPTRVHEVNAATGAATGNFFDFGAGVATHTSSLTMFDGFLWAVDYDTDKVFKIDLADSLAASAADILGSFSVGSGAGFGGHPSAMQFVLYDGEYQLMITEWVAGGKILIVDYVNALIDGTVVGNILREFTEGDDAGQGATQGLTTKDGYIFRSAGFAPTDKIGKFYLPDLIGVTADTVIFGATYRVWEVLHYTIGNYQDITFIGSTFYICDESANDLHSGTSFRAIADSSGNHHHGLSEGSMTLGDQVSGEIDGAIDFEGTDDSIDFGTSADFQFTDEVTFEMCVYLTGAAPAHHESTHAIEEADTTPGLSINARRNVAPFRFAYWDVSNGWKESTLTLARATQYYLVVVAKSDNWVDLYADGVFLNRQAMANPFPVFNGHLHVSDPWAPPPGSGLRGVLDEGRVSNTGRTAAWIAATYESGRDDLISFGAEESH